MDLSKKYINMCAGAVELQEPRSSGKIPLGHGDYLFIDKQVLIYCAFSIETVFQYPNDIILKIQEGPNDEYSHERQTDIPVVWLPKQDQLIDMLGTYGGVLITLSGIGDGDPPTDPDDFSTFEQLWLSFVMLEKYHKYWTGKKWAHTDEAIGVTRKGV